MIMLTSSVNVFAFTDVSEGDTHYMAVNYLQEQGIINGYDDGSFKPSNEINRAEALKMLTLASGIFSEEEINNLKTTDEAPFIDTPISDWYTKYLIAAKEKGIINGYPDNNFKPNNNINLVEALKIYLESQENLAYPNTDEWLFEDTPIDAWFTPYTAYAASRGMLVIWSTNNIYPDQKISRGYLAEIIYRKLKFKEGYRFGKATFYSAGLNDGGTAMKAAHKTLPFGTIVEVTNLANGKSVQVEINDRGPYGPGRVLDLSKGAFAAIGKVSSGVINIQYKVLN
jgi:hypothetical protein